MIALVLASASPSRLRILEQAGVDPLIRHPQVDAPDVQTFWPSTTQAWS